MEGVSIKDREIATLKKQLEDVKTRLSEKEQIHQLTSENRKLEFRLFASTQTNQDIESKHRQLQDEYKLLQQKYQNVQTAFDFMQTVAVDASNLYRNSRNEYNMIWRYVVDNERKRLTAQASQPDNYAYTSTRLVELPRVRERRSCDRDRYSCEPLIQQNNWSVNDLVHNFFRQY